MKKTNIVLLGAGGKMGCRITKNIKDLPEYSISYVEISEAGRGRLGELGVTAGSSYEPLKEADKVIFAVPDLLIGKISQEVIPLLKADATVIGLDPAAHFGKVMTVREDIHYFVVHPCHPSLFPFQDNLTLAEQKDWFGGTAARMDMVCSEFQGDDGDYAENESLARKMFHPIDRAFRLTVDQMIMLEPALVESITAPLIKAMTMAIDACVETGVPRDAVMAFVLGHLKVQFGVLFGFAGFQFSDGALLAMDHAMDVIFKPDWLKNIMNRGAVEQSVYKITHELGEKSNA